MKLQVAKDLLQDLEKINPDFEVRVTIYSPPFGPQLVNEGIMETIKSYQWITLWETTHWAGSEIVIVDKNEFLVQK